MFSIPIALLRRELKGPDFFLVGLFPGMIKDCRRNKKLSEPTMKSQNIHQAFSHLYIHIVMDLRCSSDIKTRSPRGLKANFKDNAAYFIRFCISALLLLIGLLSLLYVCAPEARRTIALVAQPDRRGGGEVCAWWFGPELRDERWEQDLLSSTVLCFHWGTLCSL